MPASEVDHIVPLRQAPERKYDLANLQPLCRSCHSTKTGRDRGGRVKVERVGR